MMQALDLPVQALSSQAPKKRRWHTDLVALGKATSVKR